MGRHKISKLLGKKRLIEHDDKEKEKEEDEQEEEEEEQEKNLFPSDNEENESEESESSESEDSKPAKKLFSENETGFTKVLFDNIPISTEEKESKKGTKPKPLFDLSLKENKNLSSLFDIKDQDKKNQSSSFGNLSLFNSSSFNKEKNESSKEKEKEEEEENDNNIDNIGNNSPKYEYKPEEVDINGDDNNKYVKRYIKKIEKIFLLNKVEKKYICKGEGYISIETQTTKNEEKEKKDVVFVFRNNIGRMIFEGFLNEKINSIDSYEKNGKFIVHFVFLINDEKNNLNLEHCKIPFNKEEDSKYFMEIYNDAIKYIKNEIKQFSKK